jgi:hypothetical protein
MRSSVVAGTDFQTALPTDHRSDRRSEIDPSGEPTREDRTTPSGQPKTLPSRHKECTLIAPKIVANR